MCAPRLFYATKTLYRLRRSATYPEVNVTVKLKALHLFRSRSTRQGRSLKKRILVITTSRNKPLPKQDKPYKYFEVPGLRYALPSLFLSNVTSLNNKLDEVITTSNTINVDVAATTEAWQITPETCNISGYQLFHRLRTGRRGGGLVVWCRSDLLPTLLPVDPPEGVEALWVRFNSPSYHRLAASIIHLPDLPPSSRRHGQPAHHPNN